jgi:insulysin
MNSKIYKSPNDSCNYNTFELQNKLKVFIVEDNSIDLSCVAMSVGVGYADDSVLGIAHFLEHMLFNGTKKYPDENEYSSFISKNGGYTNAYTANDHTCYYFTVQPTALSKGLDMFSDFFINPLLNPDSIDREKNAVNSEHIKNITSDPWRFQEIMKTAMYKSNTLSNFGTGSSESLDIPNISEEVNTFFTKYSSHIMTLFIITKDNLNDVSNLVKTLFTDVKYLPQSYLTDTNQLIYDYPKTLEVVPITDVDYVTLSWDIPSFKYNPLQSPVSFISHIIGHEGKNTLHYILSEAGYILNLSCGVSTYHGNRCIFDINIKLTKAGFENKEEIISATMSYIKLLKSSVNTDHMRMLYEEQSTLNALKFKYFKNVDSEDKAMTYVNLINTYSFDLENIMLIQYADENYNPNVKNNLRDVLNIMNIDTAIVVYTSRNYDNTTTLTDHNYGTNYNIYNRGVTINAITNTINIDKMSLPEINNFVTTAGDIIKINNDIPTKISKYGINLYHMPTNRYKNPYVDVKIKIDLPLSIIHKKIFVRSVLYFSSVLASINHILYTCNMADYDVSMSFDLGTLYISAYGNYEKIENVVDIIMSSITNKQIILKNKFDISKEHLITSTANEIHNSPYLRASVKFQKKMCESYYDNYDIMSVLDDDNLVTFEKVVNVSDYIFNIISCVAIVIGNCNELMSMNILDICKKSKKNYIFDNYSDDNTKLTKKFRNFSIQNGTLFYNTYSIPKMGNEIVIGNSENDSEKNSAVGHFVYISNINKSTGCYMNLCLLKIIDSLISSEYFDQLRTKEGFGYIVGSGIKTYGPKLDYSIYYIFQVQSPHKHPDEIISRTEKFILDYANEINNLTKTTLSEIIDALISQIETPHLNLKSMSNFMFYNEIEAEILEFNFKNIMIDTYKYITLENVKQFYNNKFIEQKKAVSIGSLKN